jgi:hypothetical protein
MERAQTPSNDEYRKEEGTGYAEDGRKSGPDDTANIYYARVLRDVQKFLSEHAGVNDLLSEHLTVCGVHVTLDPMACEVDEADARVVLYSPYATPRKIVLTMRYEDQPSEVHVNRYEVKFELWFSFQHFGQGDQFCEAEQMRLYALHNRRNGAESGRHMRSWNAQRTSAHQCMFHPSIGELLCSNEVCDTNFTLATVRRFTDWLGITHMIAPSIPRDHQFETPPPRPTWGPITHALFAPSGQAVAFAAFWELRRIFSQSIAIVVVQFIWERSWPSQIIAS